MTGVNDDKYKVTESVIKNATFLMGGTTSFTMMNCFHGKMFIFTFYVQGKVVS